MATAAAGLTGELERESGHTFSQEPNMLLQRLVRLTYLFTRAVAPLSGWFGASSMVALVGLMASGVVMRFVFGNPITFAEEISSYLMVSLTFMTGAYTFVKGEHISIDLVLKRLRPQQRRIMTIVNGLIGSGACLILSWYSSKLVIYSIRINSHSSTLLETPMVYPYALVPTGMGLLGLTILADTIRLIVSQITPKATK